MVRPAGRNPDESAGPAGASRWLEEILARCRRELPACDGWWLRAEWEHTEELGSRQGLIQPMRRRIRRGVMLTLADGAGIGYAATSNTSGAGLRHAARRALEWARLSASLALPELPLPPAIRDSGCFETPVERRWEEVHTGEKLELIRRAAEALPVSNEIIDWSASLTCRRREQLLASHHGGVIHQSLHLLLPALGVVAARGSQVQSRTWGGSNGGWQGGLELLESKGFPAAGRRIAREAIDLLAAPECPRGTFDLILMPDQMALQIHESIGHPLELDRILGDERNYAGGSFVTPEMFGSFRYGSQLLNVGFDPGLPTELAGYGWDDEGTPASRAAIIREGILLRPLGGRTSQSRSGLPGVACARACAWNRPPIDRMGNLNLEPGELPLPALLSRVERGILMRTNRSWSIDDRRNKFQFGCEAAWMIENGELGEMVRNPNYRGTSSRFWRSLDGVGDRSTLGIGGTPNCGKGEPNQLIHVGHASPACLFREVEVFGGEP